MVHNNKSDRRKSFKICYFLNKLVRILRNTFFLIICIDREEEKNIITKIEYCIIPNMISTGGRDVIKIFLVVSYGEKIGTQERGVAYIWPL